MGSGVLPLAMATRPAKTAERLGPRLARLSRAGAPVPGLDPGIRPGGLRPVEASCVRVFYGGGLSPSLMVLAAGRGAKADRAISTGQLRGLPRFHLRPINVMVSHGSQRDLVLKGVSRLDAFSGYPVRT